MLVPEKSGNKQRSKLFGTVKLTTSALHSTQYYLFNIPKSQTLLNPTHHPIHQHYYLCRNCSPGFYKTRTQTMYFFSSQHYIFIHRSVNKYQICACSIFISCILGAGNTTVNKKDSGVLHCGTQILLFLPYSLSSPSGTPISYTLSHLLLLTYF